MAIFIETDTRLDAWLQASEHLVEVERDLNVVLLIQSPLVEGPPGLAGRELIDAFVTGEGDYPSHTIAEWIFPGWQYTRHGIAGVFKTYAEEDYPAIKTPHMWGTYAHRLVRRRTAGGEWVNPLERLIEKMRGEHANAGSKRSCYELGIAEGEYDLPLYNSVDDQNRHRGGPCLSHLSFKLFNGSVHLTAVYRSHDYRLRAYGNLLGLARLQACVAHEVGVPVGTLAVHSTYATLEGSRAPMKSLLTNLRKVSPAKEKISALAH